MRRGANVHLTPRSHSPSKTDQRRDTPSPRSHVSHPTLSTRISTSPLSSSSSSSPSTAAAPSANEAGLHPSLLHPARLIRPFIRLHPAACHTTLPPQRHRATFPSNCEQNQTRRGSMPFSRKPSHCRPTRPEPSGTAEGNGKNRQSQLIHVFSTIKTALGFVVVVDYLPTWVLLPNFSHLIFRLVRHFSTHTLSTATVP